MEELAPAVARLNAAVIGKYCKGVCGGRGVTIVNNTFIDCKCMEVFKSRVEKLKVNIPKKYWDFNLEQLTKQFVKDNTNSLEIIQFYLDNLEESIDSGAGLYIQGTYGLAKSALAYYIAGEASRKGCNVYGLTLMSLMEIIKARTISPVYSDSYLLADALFNKLRNDIDLLILDEVDKGYALLDSSNSVSSQVHKFFIELYDNNTAVVATSNTPLIRDALITIHVPSVIDRLLELTPVTLVGESFRGTRKLTDKIKKES